MPSDLNNPVASLLCKDETLGQAHDVVVEVKNMTWGHVNLWHTHVQSLINTHYKHWAPGVAATDARADVGWDWARNYALALLHNTARYIPRNQSGAARALAMVVRTERGDDIPVGMLTVVPQFSCRVQEVTGRRTFAWYLADAPISFYRDVLGVAPVLGVAKALLDTAIQSGLDAGGDGAVLLHADPNGGQKLADFYVQKCKMIQLALSDKPISLFRRKNVDQYFFLSAQDAATFCEQFDDRR